MTGARRIVRDVVPGMIPDGSTVLDVGTGDGWLAEALQARCTVTAIDRTFDRCRRLTCRQALVDLATGKGMAELGRYDVAVAVYCLQHLLDDEAVAWRRLRDHAPRLIVAGRWSPGGPGREYDRQDPLNGYDTSGLCGLSIATGWRVSRIVRFRYENEYYEPSTKNAANAFIAECEAL